LEASNLVSPITASFLSARALLCFKEKKPLFIVLSQRKVPIFCSKKSWVPISRLSTTQGSKTVPDGWMDGCLAQPCKPLCNSNNYGNDGTERRRASCHALVVERGAFDHRTEKKALGFPCSFIISLLHVELWMGLPNRPSTDDLWRVSNAG
jgi:hypothetical protein